MTAADHPTSIAGVSIIVPAHDEEQLLGATLDAIHAALRELQRAAEVIVVDDASDDATAEIALRHGATVVRVEHRHIAAARNAGARVARGDALLFIDADTLVDSTVVGAALRALDAGAAGGGAAVHLGGTLTVFERVLQRVLVFAFRVTRLAPGCFIYCRRAAFDGAGGFDETWFAGEDIAISRALARQGPFVMLAEPVVTSARKLRTFSAREQIGLLLGLLFRGRSLLRSRSGLGLWYGKRR